MRYGYHYTPCDSSCSGPGLWLLLKLSALVGTAAGVWWVLKAIGRAMSTAASAAASAGPGILAALGIIVVLGSVGVVTFVIRNNQRPPLLPHDRPARHALGMSTVEVIDVTPNPRSLNPPRPAYQPFVVQGAAEASPRVSRDSRPAYQTFATPERVTATR
jgi:hypothetical protein